MSRVAEFAPEFPPPARAAILGLLEGRDRTLKASLRGEVRRLVSASLPHPVIVKRYPVPGLLRAAGRRLRGSAAAREFRAARALASRGVPVVRALGFVETRRGPLLGKSFVVLEDLGEAPTLLEALRDAQPARRRALLGEAGGLAADLHASGFVHGDLHAGNFLLRPGGALALADLARARPRRGELRARAADLAFLFHSLRNSGLFGRARVLRAYAARSRTPFRRLARASIASARRRAAERAESAARHAAQARYGRVASLPAGWKGIAYGERAEASARALALAGAGVKGRWARGAVAGGEAVVRRCGPGEARHAWGEIHRAAALGLPTAEPVARFERENSEDAFLALLVPAASSPLPAALLERRGRPRASALAAVGRLARHAHESGLRLATLPPDALFLSPAGKVFLAAPTDLGSRGAFSIAARRADLEAAASVLPIRLSKADRARVARAYDPFGHVFRHGRGACGR